MSSRQAASTVFTYIASTPCLDTIWMHRFCLQTQTRYNTQRTHIQTNTFAQQAVKKLKHQYQLKNMNKEQELVLGIENLVCFAILWAMKLGGMEYMLYEYGVCSPHSVFTWKCAVLVATDGTQYTSWWCCCCDWGCCWTHKFSVIFDFRNIIVYFDNKNQRDGWSLQFYVCSYKTVSVRVYADI